MPSNLNNSVDHLCALIGQRMDRLPRDPTEFEGADTFKADLRIAVEQAHHKLLATFFKWNEHVRLPDRVKARLRGKNNQVTVGSHKYTRRDFKTKGDVASQWVCNAQLHRSLLYLLIWGESANLRHLPECLCFLFYCASNAVLLTHPNYLQHDDVDVPCKDSPGPLAHSIDDYSMPVEDDFLHAIVRPIYNFLKQQVLFRKDDPISERVMYDDVNEAFWSRSLVLQLMPQMSDESQRIITAYANSARCCSTTPRLGTPEVMTHLFKKTYLEKVNASFPRCLYSPQLTPLPSRSRGSTSSRRTTASFSSTRWHCTPPSSSPSAERSPSSTPPTTRRSPRGTGSTTRVWRSRTRA